MLTNLSKIGIFFSFDEKKVCSPRNPENEAKTGTTGERPSSLNPMPLQKSSVSSNENSQEDGALLELPSPISRHGSLVGDPQLPVPTEFLDVSSRRLK